ncbi:MAG: SRPBCC family protein [Nitrospirota bacterium]
MIHKKESVLINEQITKVFAVAKDIEKLSEFIPEYKNVTILSKKENKMELEAQIKFMGTTITFISIGIITPDESIKYEQIKGPLKGLLTEWRFEEVNSKTRLSIIHTLDLRIPLIGRLIEEVIYRFAIKHMANEVLMSMKKVMGNR